MLKNSRLLPVCFPSQEILAWKGNWSREVFCFTHWKAKVCQRGNKESSAKRFVLYYGHKHFSLFPLKQSPVCWLFRLNNSIQRSVFSSATCRHYLLLQSTQSAGNCKVRLMSRCLQTNSAFSSTKGERKNHA